MVQNGFTSIGDRWNLSAIFNEMFHAIFDQLLEEQGKRCPLYAAMQKEESRYGGASYGKSVDMVEEACSETFCRMVTQALAANTASPKKPIDFSGVAMPPGHASKKERFYGEPKKYTGKSEADATRDLSR